MFVQVEFVQTSLFEIAASSSRLLVSLGMGSMREHTKSTRSLFLGSSRPTSSDTRAASRLCLVEIYAEWHSDNNALSSSGLTEDRCSSSATSGRIDWESVTNLVYIKAWIAVSDWAFGQLQSRT
jgi:hypothetical protein